MREENELWELLFADNLVIIANSEEELQQRFLAWKNNLERKGRKVNIQKIEVMVRSRKGHEEFSIISEDGRRQTLRRV